MKRNGEIELLRFVFAMIVVVFHFSAAFHFDAFARGGFGVEFFFVVTGILLGASMKKVSITRNEIPEYTYGFIKKKVARFYAYYIVVVVALHLVLYRGIVVKDSLKELITIFLYNLPRLLFFDGAGFRLSHALTIRVDWYLSAMILSLVILVPILLYNYEWAAKLILPLCGVFGLGILFINFGSIRASWEIVHSTFTTEFVRGLSQIALGVWAYEISLKIKSCRFTKLTKICLTILKWCCLAGIFLYAWGKFSDKRYSVVFFVFCLIVVILSFSEQTYNIPYNSFIGFLGKLSLLIYLSHMPIVEMCRVWFGPDMEMWKILVAICICPVIAYLIMIGTDFLLKQLKKVKYLFVEIE